MKKVFFATILVVAISMSLNAQFTVNTEIRPRTELRNGYKSLFAEDDISAYFISQRTRLGFAYNNEKYSMSIIGQDVRVWGDERVYNSTSVKGDDASIELFDAWFKFKFDNYSSIKIGRQQWAYDDQRLLSARNWGQTGLAYDAILFNYDNSNYRIDLGLSLNNEAENKTGNLYTPDKFKYIDFIYLSKKLGQKSMLSFTGILSGNKESDTTERVYNMVTYGPYFKIKNEKFELEGSAFHQFGKNANDQKVNAYLLSLRGIYKLSEKISFGPGIDIISGNDLRLNKNTDYSFDVLYGGRHRFLGEMDYFNDLAKGTWDAGIVDWYGKANINFNKKNNVSIAYHYLTTHRKIAKPEDLSKDLDKELGNELDIMYKYKPEIPADLRIGLSIFKASETMEIVQGVSDNPEKIQYFMWVQLTFTPELFNSGE